MYQTLIHNSQIFVEFLYRDFFVYRKKILNDLLNYALICPLVLSISFVYVQANIYFGANDAIHMGTMVFAGNILIPLMTLAYKLTFELLFDLEQHRFVNYQIILLHPRLVIVERILFGSIISFLVTLPFFPMSKLFLGNHFFTDNTNWISLCGVLLAASCCTVAYHQFFAAFLRAYQIGMFWVRINHVAMFLAGAFVPVYTIKEYSPFLGKLIALNPLLYATEGVRHALLANESFLPAWYCIIIMNCFTLFFTSLTWHAFKKRVDHI